MRPVCLLRYALVAWVLMAGGALACSYPGAFRLVNSTLTDQLERGGEVGVYVRSTLRRALNHMPPDAMLTSLRGEVSRAELRAARRVLEAANGLADGRGRKVNPELRSDTLRLTEAVELDCANGTLSASEGGNAQGADGGGARRDGGAGNPLTFQEGMTRLSIAFTLYAVFLVALFAFRQFYHRNVLASRTDDAAPVMPPPDGAEGNARLAREP